MQCHILCFFCHFSLFFVIFRNLSYVFIKSIDNAPRLRYLEDNSYQPPDGESEDFPMTEEKKRTTTTILAVVLAVVLLCSLCASLYSAKGIYDLKAEATAADETTEDNVKIMNGEYEILSTTQISDAYKSGSTSGLSDKDKETLEMATKVLDEVITDDMTTAYDKEKAIYDWMTTKLKYDTGVLQVIPQTTADCDNPYGVLKYHNAVCVGYATTFRLFMQMMDIPCMVVHNTEKYHSWDLVQLDGDWYHVDIYSDQDGGTYANFNMNDELARQNHDWDTDFFPAATSLKYNYGYQNKQPVDDIYSIPKMIRQALDQKQGCLFLDFPTIDEEHAQIVEAILSGVQSSMDATPDYQMMWSNWTWIHVTGNEYVLAYFLQGYDTDDSANVDLSDEEQAKVEQAVNSVFGEDVDWDSIKSELDNRNDMATNTGVTAVPEGAAEG